MAQNTSEHQRSAELPRTPFPRTSGNPPSTHSGELTLGIWLLQQPTHRDHGPTEHRHRRIRSSGTSEGPGVLPVLTSHHALRASRAPYLLIPSSQSPPCILSHTFLYNPTNPTTATVFSVSKGFLVVGLPTRTRRCSR